MFWENLTNEEQERYWYISQRLKKYVAANLELPNARERMDEWLRASTDGKEEICRREERRINHFIRKTKDHVTISVVAMQSDLEYDLGHLEVYVVDCKCTDKELIEASLLADKAWKVTK